jgi:hypothetical protein
LAAIGFQRTVAMSDTNNFPDYQMIKAMALELGRPVTTLIALSDSRDPFYVTPGRRALAQWFAQIWDVLDPPNGYHLRRLHYRIVVMPDAERPKKLNGDAYENTEQTWKTLSDASVDARALDLIPADKFTDRRAGEPIFIADDSQDEHTRAFVGCYGEWLDSPPKESPFAIEYTPSVFEFPALPEAFISGPRHAEPFAIEVWCEKSTANDILVPLAERLNVTLVTGLGELSFTHCLWHVRRVLAHGKKARILYISDFDPSGAGMPVSVARKIEYLLRRDGHDLDIRLDPIALTTEQVERYQLPRVPIKDSDAGKRHFEARFGVGGATELDALEAIRPGTLARIVEERVRFYRNPTRQAQRDNGAIQIAAATEIRAMRAEVLAEHESEIAAMRENFAAMQAEIEVDQQALAVIAEDATARSQAHVAAINERVASFYGRAAGLWRRIGAALTRRLPAADAFAWVEPEPPDAETEELFDSRRDYLDQIEIYKERTGRPTGRRGNGNGGAP